MSNNVIIPRSEKLEKIKHEIAKEGANNIHVISDFDRTLTKAFVDGKEVPSLVSVLRNENYLTPDYPQKAHALFDKYHPIEINPSISVEEKKKAMHEWWTTHFKLLIKSKLNIKDLEKVVNSDSIKLRKGALEFLDLLHDYKIPLIILSSGGLGKESISMYLKKEERLYDNIHIISNEFEWDKDGYAIGIKEPIIHCMNKDETAIKTLPVYKLIEDRKNVLLLGDGIGDMGMIKGFDYNNIIKAGFLNKHVKENFKSYSNNFDIILTNDSDMLCINELLKELVE